jgi:hypothetical protein
MLRKRGKDSDRQQPQISLQRGVLESDLKALEEADRNFAGSLYDLDVRPLLPFVPQNQKNTGRMLHKIICETLDGYLVGNERYIYLEPGKFLLYLGPNRKLCNLKVNIACEEIRRRIEQFMRDQSGASGGAAQRMELAPHSLKQEKWQPPKEDHLPRKVPPADLEMKKMATMAIQEMIEKYEKKSYGVDYHKLAEDIKIGFKPVWNVPKNHLTGYTAFSLTPLEGRESSFISARAMADIGLMARATTMLQGAVDGNRPLVLILPVSFSTLDHQPFHTYFMRYLRNLTPAVRALTVLQVHDINFDLPSYRVEEKLREFSSLLRALIIAADLLRPRRDSLINCRINAFSCSLLDISASETICFSLLDQFAMKMQKMGHAAMAEDIPTRSLLYGAIGAGFTYVSGPAVYPDQETLDAIRPFDLSALYK